MKKKLLILIPLFIIFISMKSDKPAYKLYKQNGKEIKYKKLLKEALQADIIFFGEFHNNPICHWLQFELTKDIHRQKKQNLILGAEMIEADDQENLNDYLKDEIKEKDFEEKARLWKNYKTDYKPLVEFAKENELKFIATNIPRKYASLVYKKGFEALDTLPSEIKLYIAPLPIAYDSELKGYKEMLKMASGMGHSSPNLPKAQAIKDATMAHFILQNWKNGQCFIHYNGGYHSKNFEGIIWYLKQANPSLNILSINAVEQEDIRKLNKEHENSANYILVIPQTMTKTY